MNFLGICNGKDSGAAIIVDGKIAAAANEERFLRKKLTREFPVNSIKFVLKHANLTLNEIDYIGCGTWNGIDQEVTMPRLVEDIFYQFESEDVGVKSIIEKRLQASIKSDKKYKEILFENLDKMNFPRERVLSCDHHYAHALTGFYCSPFEDGIVFTADGRGDFRSITLWEARRESGLKLIDFTTELTSPGALYGFITKFLGFVPDRHEGKVTGLSARGQITPAYDLLKKGFFYDEEAKTIRSKIGSHYSPFASANIEELFSELANFSREDVAFAAQKLLEETLAKFLSRYLDDQKIQSANLCLAGGCFSNVKLNYELFNLSRIENIYVFPQMGDGGNALGGALHAATKKSENLYYSLPTAYLGPEYSDDEIVQELKKHDLSFEKFEPDEIINRVVELLANDKIVGWFQGRMEYGPRALGARSILASATDVKMTKILNERLHRNDFMPFAPVTINDTVKKCFLGWEPDHFSSRFMTLCYRCTPLLKEKCPAVVHVDNTARPQVVFQEDNPKYFELLKIYIKKTGNPVLINTSFNHHEEPIVNSPYDAVKSLMQGNVDFLAIGNLLVFKN